MSADQPDQSKKAETFRRLHRGARILILPNAWDVASARLFEDAGFPAVATSSAGLMVSLGYPDGEAIDREDCAGPLGPAQCGHRRRIRALAEGGRLDGEERDRGGGDRHQHRRLSPR